MLQTSAWQQDPSRGIEVAPIRSSNSWLKAAFERQSETASFTKKVALRRKTMHEERNLDMMKKDDDSEVAWVAQLLFHKQLERKK
jgi:hypothetical protein